MAKKKRGYSPEEWPEQALVPADGQPFEVPNNWVWIRLESIAKFHQGVQVPVDEQYREDGDKRIRFIRIIDYTQNTDDIRYIDSSKIRLDSVVNETDIVMIRYGSAGLVGKGIKGIIANNMFKITTPDKLKPYIRMYLSSPQVFEHLNNSGSSTVMPAINFKLVSAIQVPLPPLPEQQRIVDRIESLFEKLDQAREVILSAIDAFETRKAAILHKAFTGELTNRWREEHSIGIDNWEVKSLKEICKISSGGTPSRSNPQFYSGDIPWIKTGEINWNYITDSEEKINQEAIDNSSAKLFDNGTVLVAMYGQGLTRGRAAILNIKATTNQAVCALIPNETVNNKFLFYYFMDNYWNFRERAVGGNQPNYSGTMIGEFLIKIPTLAEQKEVVRILNDIFEKEQQAKSLYDVIEQINLMKKSILARAFRGELGTNDPYESSAMELLKDVMVG